MLQPDWLRIMNNAVNGTNNAVSGAEEAFVVQPDWHVGGAGGWQVGRPCMRGHVSARVSGGGAARSPAAPRLPLAPTQVRLRLLAQATIQTRQELLREFGRLHEQASAAQAHARKASSGSTADAVTVMLSADDDADAVMAAVFLHPLRALPPPGELTGAAHTELAVRWSALQVRAVHSLQTAEITALVPDGRGRRPSAMADRALRWPPCSAGDCSAFARVPGEPVGSRAVGGGRGAVGGARSAAGCQAAEEGGAEGQAQAGKKRGARRVSEASAAGKRRASLHRPCRARASGLHACCVR